MIGGQKSATKIILRDAEEGKVGAAIRLIEQGEDVCMYRDELMRNVLHVAAGAGKG